MKPPETSKKSFISIDAGFDKMCTQHFYSEKIMPENATKLNVTIISLNTAQKNIRITLVCLHFLFSSWFLIRNTIMLLRTHIFKIRLSRLDSYVTLYTRQYSILLTVTTLCFLFGALMWSIKSPFSPSRICSSFIQAISLLPSSASGSGCFGAISIRGPVSAHDLLYVASCDRWGNSLQCANEGLGWRDSQWKPSDRGTSSACAEMCCSDVWLNSPSADLLTQWQ